MRSLPFAGALVALLFGSSSTAEAQFLSPGPLASAHARLEGDDKCDRCHSSGRGVDDGKCLGCHGPIARSIQGHRGLHGRGVAGQRCSSCHLDHRGAGFRMVRWPGGDPARLDHSLTGWPLRGSHAGKPCRACHAGQGGGLRWIGTSTACGSCHEDPHAGRFGTSCSSCHNEVHWAETRMENFDHARTRYALDGRHVQVRCPQCHGQPPRYRGIRFASCADCHQDPHGGRMTGPCANCHRTSGWSDLGAIRANHPRLSLGGGHSNVRCERCHDRGSSTAPSRGSACVSCHAPVHEAGFGRSCAQCHRGIRWLGLPRQIGLDSHPRTPFPLRGAHQEVRCDDCHDPRKPARQRFRELAFDRCNKCHEDRHSGEFAARDGGECGACHGEDGFRPTTFGIEAHASTQFALVGRHQATPCGGCHAGERPRLAFRVQRQRCADCHENPHGEQFAREMRAGGCASCHTALDWRQPNIDHSTWPLTGAHQAAPCNACHSPTAADRTNGRGASYRGVPRRCEGCHDDVHAGQFRLSDPVKGCDACHGTAQFRIRRFDHAPRTGYALEGRHERLECAKCHAPAELRNGAQAIRYRLGYQACADCHANPHRERQR